MIKEEGTMAGKVLIEDKTKYHEEMGVNMDRLLYYHLGRIIRPVHDTVKQNGNEFMQLSSVQRNIMGNLTSRGDCTIGELAAFSNCSYKNMSKFLESIEELGLVERYINPDKRRYVYVRMTEKGREVHTEFTHAAYKEAQRVFDEVFTDKEQLDLLKYYQKINKIFAKFEKKRDLRRDNGEIPDEL